MVRRDLRLIIGVGVFVLLVGALAFIALNRDPGPSPLGRWDVVFVETPDGTIEAGIGEGWIQIDGSTFHGVIDCIDFEGDYRLGQARAFQLDGWGYSSMCEPLAGTGEAFDLYFGNITNFRLDYELSLESADGSVRFVFVPVGQA